jgi:hypothetical protein
MAVTTSSRHVEKGAPGGREEWRTGEGKEVKDEDGLKGSF